MQLSPRLAIEPQLLLHRPVGFSNNTISPGAPAPATAGNRLSCNPSQPAYFTISTLIRRSADAAPAVTRARNS